jgi:hypothetical protein
METASFVSFLHFLHQSPLLNSCDIPAMMGADEE